MKKEPVVIVFSILAVLQVIDAALVLADGIDETTGAIISMIIAALTAGATVYVRGMVTPWADVVSKITENGTVVAGPAAGPAGNTGIVGPEAGGTPPPPAPPKSP